jgi:hypothetical protein
MTHFNFIGSNGLDSNEDTADANSMTGWYPYLSKLAFLLNTVDNLPCLQILSSMMKVIVWLLQEIGVTKVPSFAQLQLIQKQIKEEQIVSTI